MTPAPFAPVESESRLACAFDWFLIIMSQGVIPLALVGVVIYFLVSLGIPWASDASTRYRLSGTWHVAGSFADWRFGRDGTWTEDALIDTQGSYTLLDDDRIRIKGLLGATMDFEYTFDDEGLLLKGDSGTPFSFRLRRKD
ncbi:MAG: hypothetical protein IT430_09350 [Phycisphaerales bacterium]|nr:hypothetical protein [Phycisphaerales bacterium]